MSDNERPEKQAFKQLEKLVRNLGDELSSFRRRAQQAESKLKAIEVAAGTAEGDSEDEEISGAARIALAQLRKENAELKGRLESARARTKHMMDRVRFLRQQQQKELASVGGGGGAK